MEKVNFIGLTGQFMRENLKTIFVKVRENILMKMGRLTKEILKIIFTMVKGFSNTKMEINMKVLGKKV